MRRWQGLVALVFGATIVGGGVVGAATTQTSANDRSPGIVASARGQLESLAELIGLDDEESLAPGTLDDGKDLLPQATITLDQAIAAAQASTPGPLGEVDLEYYQGTLVFNVDVGNHDVKVDAATGNVIGSVSDD
jgi:uncharacterized membrane protein YkoI